MTWNKDAYYHSNWSDEFCLEDRDAEFCIQNTGRMEVRVWGGSGYESFDGGSADSLTLEQAIDMAAFLNCVVIPKLLEEV